LNFAKYQGGGNDFILIADGKGSFPFQNADYIQRLCLRNRGIGADGLILLQECDTAPLRMRIFNPDGSEARMCGNGILCARSFAQTLGLASEGEEILIEAGEWLWPCKQQNKEVSLLFPFPMSRKHQIVLPDGQDRDVHFLSVGVPHGVVLVDEVDLQEVEQFGRWIRWHPEFAPEGINVTFSGRTLNREGFLPVRCYEKGVEAETLSSGTAGVAASWILWEQNQQAPPTVKIYSPGGSHLTVCRGSTGITLTGKPEYVFSGSLKGMLSSGMM
jgi:diaminopimelate epimerase